MAHNVTASVVTPYLDIGPVVVRASAVTNTEAVGLVTSKVACVKLAWSDLGIWGSGAARVQVTYNYSDPYYGTGSKNDLVNLSAAEATTGATVVLTNGFATTVTRVRLENVHSISSAWGEIVGAGVYDASSGGNLLWYWEWDQPRVVAANDTMRVEAEEIEWTFSSTDPVNDDCVLSRAVQEDWLDAIFGYPSAPSVPGTLYAALMTTVPDDEDADGVELTGTNYARSSIVNSATNWEAYASGLKTNKTQIVWPQAGGAWSSVTSIAFYDASSSGNLRAKLKLASTQSWVSGDIPRIAAGQLPIYAE
jgi:hypothetical protein